MNERKLKQLMKKLEAAKQFAADNNAGGHVLSNLEQSISALKYWTRFEVCPRCHNHLRSWDDHEAGCEER